MPIFKMMLKYNDNILLAKCMLLNQFSGWLGLGHPLRKHQIPVKDVYLITYLFQTKFSKQKGSVILFGDPESLGCIYT